MKLSELFRHKENLSELVHESQLVDLAAKMAKLIRVEGDLPVSADVQSLIQKKVSQPGFRIEEIPGVLCSDLIIPIRLIALMNSSVYSRGREVYDLEVIGSQLGVTSIAEKLSELGKVAPIREMFRGRSLALVAYEDALLRAQIAQRIEVCLSPQVERFAPSLAFTLSLFAELPAVLLAYVKPNIYAACRLESLFGEGFIVEKSLKRVFGGSRVEFFRELSKEIGFPSVVEDFFEMLEIAPWNKRGWVVENSKRNARALTAAYVAGRMKSHLSSWGGRQSFYSSVKAFEGKGELSKPILENCLASTSSRFASLLQDAGLPSLRLPDYLKPYEDQIVHDDGSVEEVTIPWSPISDRLDPFLTELKVTLDSIPVGDEFSRFPQALLCTFLALIRGLEFDRCILFGSTHDVDGRSLVPKIIVGDHDASLYRMERKLSELGSQAPEKTAFRERKAVFLGDPVIEGGWPFVVFPIVHGIEVVGVIYADKKETKDSLPLSTEEQLSCIALSEVWHGVSSQFF